MNTDLYNSCSRNIWLDSTTNRIRRHPDLTSMWAAWLPTPPSPITTIFDCCNFWTPSSPKKRVVLESCSFSSSIISASFDAALVLCTAYLFRFCCDAPSYLTNSVCKIEGPIYQVLNQDFRNSRWKILPKKNLHVNFQFRIFVSATHAWRWSQT